MPKYGLLLTLAVLAALTARLLTPPFIHLFHQGRQLKRNFRRELIPQGTGILFVLCSLPWYALYLATAKLSLPDISTVFLLALAVLTMGLLGLLDDLLGSRDIRGLRGHFKALLSGQLTTGSLKAAGGLAVALLVSSFWFSRRGEILVSTLVLALFTNLLNLLDLRPGRAIKFYLGLVVIVGLSSVLTGNYQLLLLMLPLIGTVVGYFPFDLKARAMMGDAGANVLGISAGILAVSQLDYSGKLTALAILVLVHVVADRYSLSRLIAHSRILSLFDNLGRQN